MCKSKILFIIYFCVSIILVSCSDDSQGILIDTSDIKSKGIEAFFEVDNPDVVTRFISHDYDNEITPPQSAMDIPPVAYGPDLIISRIATTFGSNPTPCSPDPMWDANCNTFYTITMDVSNIGTVTATGGHVAMLYNTITNSTTSRTVNPSLAPGQTVSLNIGPFQICSGSVPPTIEQLIGFADFWNDVDETREDNNRSRPFNFCLN